MILFSGWEQRNKNLKNPRVGFYYIVNINYKHLPNYLNEQSCKACSLHSKIYLTINLGMIKSLFPTHHQFFAFLSALKKGWFKKASSYTNPWSKIDRKEKTKKNEKRKSLERKASKESELSTPLTGHIFLSTCYLFLSFSQSLYYIS